MIAFSLNEVDVIDYSPRGIATIEELEQFSTKFDGIHIFIKDVGVIERGVFKKFDKVVH